MKCFYHQSEDAVGLCKACSKGVCPSCAIDVGGGLACRETCVEAVKAINSLVTRNVKISVVNKRATYVWPIFFFVMGSIFLLESLLGSRRPEPFGLVLGIAFACLSLYLGWLQRSALRGP